MTAAPPPEHPGVRFIASRVLAKSFGEMVQYRLQFKTFGGGWSPELARDLFVSGEAAMVLPYDPATDRVLLVRQFRLAPWVRGDDPWIYECVAGRLEGAPSAEACAIKETREETGQIVEKLWPIPGFYTSPGIHAEYMHGFCARVSLPETGGVFGRDEEHEDIESHILPAGEAIDRALSGAVVSGPSCLCLYWFALMKDKIRQNWLATGAK